MLRYIILLFAAFSLSACYPVFKEKKVVHLTFDEVPPAAISGNFSDLMCCYRCTV